MAYVFACILGLLAAGQASIIPNGLSAYNTPLLNYGTGIPLAPGALNLYGPSVAPSSVSYSLPINKQYIHAAPVAVAPAVAAYAAPVAHVAPAVAAYAAPVAHVAPAVAAYAAPVAHFAAPAVTSADVSSQYHSQDELGQYSFGYSNKDQTRNEERDAYGRVTGSYSYVDEYGRVNQQSYIADEGGFRVTGNNLPVHHLGKRSLYSGAYPASTGQLAHGYHNVGAVAHPGYHVAPEIRTVHQVAAPVAHVAPAIAAYAAPVAHVAPAVAEYAAPVAHFAAPAVTSPDVSSQYHSQDELGQYSFGYSNKDQTRNEERDAYGRVTGSYSYVDEYGRVNQQSYIADEGGFRVTGNNLPVHHLGKRSLYSGAYPASTGPLAHGYHNVGAVTHPGYHVAPEIRTVHQVAAPVHHAVAPVHHVVKPVHHVVKPVTYAVKPVAYANKPVAHVAAPVHHVVKPLTYAAKPVVHVAKPVAYVPNPLAYAIKAPVHVAHVAGYAVPKKVSYATRGTAPVYG